MNWKQTLNPWRYARGLEAKLKEEEFSSRQFAGELKDIEQGFHQQRARADELFRDNAALKAELATALDALRIAEDRADKNAVACDAAHDVKPVDITWAELSEIGNAIRRLRQQQSPAQFGAIPKDTRRTKPKTDAQIEAAAAREAEVALADAYQERDGKTKRTGK